jgi:hypothetical protein
MAEPLRAAGPTDARPVPDPRAPTSSDLIRRVSWVQAGGFVLLLGILVGDDLYARAVPRPWELVEIAAGVVVVAVSLWATRRLTSRIRLLDELVSVCMVCKRVRSEDRWVPIEAFLTARTDAAFSHGLCPTCYEREYAE